MLMHLHIIVIGCKQLQYTKFYMKILEVKKVRVIKKFKYLVMSLVAVGAFLGVMPEMNVKAASAPSVSYSAHVQNNGWLGSVSNGQSAGTTGYGYRAEAIRISLGNATGNITYSVHVQNIGWMNWVQNGEEAGTTGQALRIEAIKINLTGAISQKYDVYYRTHIQNIGWTGWTKNGAVSGTEGQSLRMEAYQVELVKKGSSPITKGDAGQTPPVVISLGQQIADYACQFNGNPYVYGGTSLTNGCDCSGFVMSVYANFGISLPHSAQGMRSCGYGVGVNEMQPGDVICYEVQNGNNHVGIYIGNNTVICAGSTSTGIHTSQYNYRPIHCIQRMY
jgi:uncharacterized protein YjdB